MLLEDTRRSTVPVKVSEPHFPARDEFRGASYATRYELLCHKLVRERLYDAACLVLSPRGNDGEYTEPSVEIDFRTFMASLIGHITGRIKMAP
jgi:hypothetical protein